MSRIFTFLFRPRTILVLSDTNGPKRISIKTRHYVLIYMSSGLLLISFIVMSFISIMHYILMSKSHDSHKQDLTDISQRLESLKSELNLFSKYVFFSKYRMPSFETISDPRYKMPFFKRNKKININSFNFNANPLQVVLKDYAEVKKHVIYSMSSHVSRISEIQSSATFFYKNKISVINADLLNSYDAEDYDFISEIKSYTDHDLRNSYLSDLDKLIYDIFISQEKLDRLPVKMPMSNFKITSMFGYRIDPISKGVLSAHKGIDLKGNSGSSVFATGSGIIKRADFLPSYGYVVDVDHGDNIMTRYAHMKSIVAKAGQYVKAGSTIGYQGETGYRVTGPHLHYEIRVNNIPTNPFQMILAASKIKDNALVFNNNSYVKKNEKI